MFAERLRGELDKRRWRAATLHAAIKDAGGVVSRSAVYGWVHGTRPSFEHVCLILRALNVADSERRDWMHAGGYRVD